MYLLKGCYRESGGFVDNYWYCGYTDYIMITKEITDQRRCPYTTPARNREEAEAETELQKRGCYFDLDKIIEQQKTIYLTTESYVRPELENNNTTVWGTLNMSSSNGGCSGSYSGMITGVKLANNPMSPNTSNLPFQI